MKHMRKFLSLLLVCAFCAALFAGCAKAKEEQNPAGTISNFESQTHFQPGTSGDESASGDTSREPVSGEFVVSEKKYDYNGANLELLYVENQTNRHYNVTIHGTYLDENGETIEEETQTFEGFPSGWSNNFIFYPRKAFDSFTYIVETEEYAPEMMHADETGTPYVSYITFTYEKNLQWMRGLTLDAEEVRKLNFNGSAVSSHLTTPIVVEFHLLILDANGEIYLTDHEFRDYMGVTGGYTYQANPVGTEEDHNGLFLKQQEIGEDETIPETVQGVFTAVFAVIGAYDREEWLQKVMDEFGDLDE